MSRIPYTICRHGMIYYNRRVPKHAVSAYGSYIMSSETRANPASRVRCGVGSACPPLSLSGVNYCVHRFKLCRQSDASSN